MKSITLKNKILLIISGLLVALVFGEGFFRIAGFAVRNARPAGQGNNNSYRILCIGDSSTYGLGASDPQKFSYPARLQQILDEQAPSQKFNVINAGIPGINSSQALNRFRGSLAKYKPDLVIIMVGINDPWNLEESNIARFYQANLLETGALQLDALINRLRVYRFFKLLVISKMMPHSGREQDPKVPPFNFNDPDKSRSFAYSPFRTVRSRALGEALRHNILAMKLIAEESRARVMFMKYHKFGWGRPEILLNQVYTTINVPVVDNESLFRKAESLGLDVRGKDGWHPSDLGYLLLARNVFNTLVTSGILEGAPLEIFSIK